MDVDRLLCARVHSHPVCPLIGQGLGGQLRLAGFWAVGGWQGLGGQLEAGTRGEASVLGVLTLVIGRGRGRRDASCGLAVWLSSPSPAGPCGGLASSSKLRKE